MGTELFLSAVCGLKIQLQPPSVGRESPHLLISRHEAPPQPSPGMGQYSVNISLSSVKLSLILVQTKETCSRRKALGHPNMRAGRDPRTQVTWGAEVQLLLRTAVGLPSGLAPSLWSRSFWVCVRL